MKQKKQKKQKKIFVLALFFTILIIVYQTFNIERVNSGSPPSFENNSILFSTPLSGLFNFTASIKSDETLMIPLFLQRGQSLEVFVKGNNFSFVNSDKSFKVAGEINSRDADGIPIYGSSHLVNFSGVFYLKIFPLEVHSTPIVSLSISSQGEERANESSPIPLTINRGEVSFKKNEQGDSLCLMSRDDFYWSSGQASCPLRLEIIPAGKELIYSIKPNKTRSEVGVIVRELTTKEGVELSLKCGDREKETNQNSLFLQIEKGNEDVCTLRAKNQTNKNLGLALTFLLRS